MECGRRVKNRIAERMVKMSRYKDGFHKYGDFEVYIENDGLRYATTPDGRRVYPYRRSRESYNAWDECGGVNFDTFRRNEEKYRFF